MFIFQAFSAGCQSACLGRCGLTLRLRNLSVKTRHVDDLDEGGITHRINRIHVSAPYRSVCCPALLVMLVHNFNHLLAVQQVVQSVSGHICFRFAAKIKKRPHYCKPFCLIVNNFFIDLSLLVSIQDANQDKGLLTEY